MRIVHIYVKDLFGIFTHDISLNLEERITIMHGPNGLGKTVLLTMIDSIISGQYSIFKSIPFTEFIVGFDDGRSLVMKKIIKSIEMKVPSVRRNGDLILELSKKEEKLETLSIKPMRNIRLAFPIDAIENVIPELERVGPSAWLYLPTQETLSIEEVMERYGDILPMERRTKDVQPEWLVEIKNKINIRFIETQRLLTYSSARRVRGFEEKTPLVPAVKNYSDEIVSMIQVKLAEYATLSQSLDRSFPSRLVKGGSSSQHTIEQLRTELDELEQKRTRLEITGLLDRQQEIDFKEFLNIDESNSNVLSVYIEDVKRKLAVFDELTNKIDLLVKIVNNRFLYKEMSISKKEGFTIKASNGKQVPIANLSSGEQHELVLFYELLFKIKPNSLILIDEPELSLHVVWQQQFLDDLQEITKLTGIDILIATHSPQIIHDRWDLTIELKGPKDA